MQKISILTACIALSLIRVAWADVRLAKVFTDHMVLQRELPIAVFGWADPGEKVSVIFNGQTGSTIAAENGRWRVTLPAMKADGKAHRLSVQGKDKVELADVLLGEVWVGCGQSNMSRGLRFVKQRAIRAAMDSPNYRLFHVELTLVPQANEIAGVRGWAPATHESMNKVFVHPKAGPYEFSEVTYEFGKRLHEELKVPVGVISTAMPGSTVQEWTPVEKPEAKFDFSRHQDCRGPGALYQAMLQGIPPLAIRGAVWYQGENDAQNANYRRDLQTIIEAWRAKFERPDMPFYMAQIGQTTFMGGMLGVWEAESWVMGCVPNTGLAPSNDLWDGGDRSRIRKDANTGFPMVAGGDPHPPNKHVMARRLADIALARTYGTLKREVFGPMYESHEVRGGKILVKMKHVGGGLRTDDAHGPNWFEVSDGTRQGSRDQTRAVFVPADARIVSKDTIEVWAANMPSPKHVRFAWHALARHNLYNAEGLPGVPFCTDLIAVPQPIRVDASLSGQEGPGGSSFPPSAP